MQLRRLLVILAVSISTSLLVCCQSTGKVTFQNSDFEHQMKQGEASQSLRNIM